MTSLFTMVYVIIVVVAVLLVGDDVNSVAYKQKKLG
ncbi:MAG: hypothetical protein BWY46_01746 [Firmicutes bacterium ADurb.Bin300]|nr:MAG: hypothetical protein BWY46_01746 [Firmicutes bacterium ADurb.Bin300]